MSRIKNYYENELERIAEKSGYTWWFLMEKFFDEMDGAIELETFEQMAIAHAL